MPDMTCDIRQHFQISTSLKEKTFKITKSLANQWMKKTHLTELPPNLTYVGIHIRRGDKASSTIGWNVPKPSYFVKAAQFFRDHFPNCVFIVASESVKYAKHYFQNISDFVFVEGDTLLDMATLASCNHTIMSVGTFSWWAAWLAGGTTVFYKNHVKPGSNPSLFFDDDDFFLPSWIPMTD